MHFTIGNRLSTNEQVYISDGDWRIHSYLIGATGSGKTTLLENLISQHLESGRGFCYTDRHGDSARTIADTPQRPVIYWKPADCGLDVGDADEIGDAFSTAFIRRMSISFARCARSTMLSPPVRNHARGDVLRVA